MKIAVLGLGIIGSAWAKNLMADGHALRESDAERFPELLSIDPRWLWTAGHFTLP